ncbi:MAG: C-terminal binding protein [Chloroflexota bacterium]|nr:C-terminal binding protein [Chloroflexota bacterium]
MTQGSGTGARIDQRWNPSTWGKPGMVAFCGRFPMDPTTKADLAAGGIEPVVSPLVDDNGKVPDVVADADMVILSGQGGSPAIFDQFRRARFVLRPYVGYDDIDVDALTERGILVANIPDTFIQEVADQAMMLILACVRKTRQMDQLVRSGEWARGAKARELARPMRRLSTMTLGLVGFGNIARMVAERAKPFGFTIIAADPFIPAEVAQQAGVKLVSLEELMSTADVISIHTFLSKDTRGLISRELIGRMKPGAYLVNTARGPIVDEQALIEALQNNRIAGAGLDVMEVEPLPAESPLNRLENVTLAPHLASYSDEGVYLHNRRVAKIVLDVASGKLPERKIVINKKLYDEVAARPELANVEQGSDWQPLAI